MARLIEADALVDVLEDLKSNLYGWQDYNTGIDSAVYEVENAPTVDAVEVVHGRWEPELMPTGIEYSGWEEMTVQALSCSECRKLIDVGDSHFSYCPNCGAKMDGGE